MPKARISEAKRACTALLVLALTVLVSACATNSYGPVATRGVYKVGAPYMIKGVRYVPREQPDYDETGIASWYGPGFHGNRTANGETFDQNSISAAHPTLPMPVNVRVTNLDNGRSLIVRVNDRGPFHDGRIIDLSSRAAELLGFRMAGTARVRVKYIGPAYEPDFAIAQASPPPAPRTQPRSAPPSGPVIAMAPIPNPVPEMKPVPNPGEVVQVAQAELPPPDAEAADAAEGPGSDAPPAASIEMEDGETGTLNRAAQIAAAAAALIVSPAQAGTPPATGRLGPTRYYVQVGTFSRSENAEALYRDLAAFGRAAIVPTLTDGTPLYRVRIGPIASREEAAGIMQDVISRGHRSAQVVSE